MHGHAARLLGFWNGVERIGHRERGEDMIAEVLFQTLPGQLLHQAPDPVDARTVHPLRPGFEEQRTDGIPLALTRLERAQRRAGEAIAETGCVGEELPNRDLRRGWTNHVSARRVVERLEH